MADHEKVWAAAKEVWDDLPSATISRGFVLAFALLKRLCPTRDPTTFFREKMALFTQM
jgi:hypothetical protein